ncbi:MAG: NUDIX domain-containing protein [Burkholderiaceae bacterium]
MQRLDATRLRARADQPPAALRVTLSTHDGAPIGSIEPALAHDLCNAGLPLAPHPEGWRVATATLDSALERIARWLSTHRLGGRWRDERLAVADASGHVVGAIERAVVRPLGIATCAVHLVGHTPEGRVWVQQRALGKAVDPGRWDTLMGGLMAAGETVAQTLERETWEEAGLRIAQLSAVHEFARLTVRRPLEAGSYMVEHMHCFEAGVPAGLQPANQDGEVLRFEALTPDVLRDRLYADAFTVEAALVLLCWVEAGAGAAGAGV